MDRPTEAIRKLSECVAHDACDMERCDYFTSLEDMQEILEWVEYLDYRLAEPKDAEMAVTGSDGETIYLKNVDSILLLADKNYGINYCGVFR